MPGGSPDSTSSASSDVRWSLAGPPGRELYAGGHVPGAVFLDAETELSSPGDGPGRHPLPTAEKLARALGDAGIGDQHVVVAYDDAGGSVAARLWWLFRHFGHDGGCAVLDGGIDAWTDAGGALTGDPARLPPATWTPRQARDDVIDASKVAALVAAHSAVILDARAGERYRGEVEPIDPQPGHVPGAISAPWADNIGPDGRFLGADDLRRRYAARGALDRPVVAYCGSGLSASHDLLALAVLGVDGDLYEGSWSDWSADRSRPVAIGPEP